jgi:hypothetical protein
VGITDAKTVCTMYYINVIFALSFICVGDTCSVGIKDATNQCATCVQYAHQRYACMHISTVRLALVTNTQGASCDRFVSVLRKMGGACCTSGRHSLVVCK